jgi:hypothetical protein
VEARGSRHEVHCRHPTVLTLARSRGWHCQRREAPPASPHRSPLLITVTALRHPDGTPLPRRLCSDHRCLEQISPSAWMTPAHPPRLPLVCASPLPHHLPLPLWFMHCDILLVYLKWNRNHSLDPSLDDPKGLTQPHAFSSSS